MSPRARPLLIVMAVLTLVVVGYAIVQSVRAGSVFGDLLEQVVPAVLAFAAARLATLRPPVRWLAALPLAAAVATVLAARAEGGVFRVLVQFVGGSVIFWWVDRRGRYVAAEEERARSEDADRA